MQGVLHERKTTSAGKITLIYLLISIVWVVGTDQLNSVLVKDPNINLALQTYKGWFFVATTSILIYLLIQREERQIKSFENRTKILLEAIPDLIFRFDIDGNFVDYSAADENDLAFPAKKFIGKNVTEVMSHEIALQMIDAIRLALQTGKVQTFEYHIQMPQGLLFYEARTVARNGDVITFVRNITEDSRHLEALKNSEEKFSHVFNNNPEIMLIASLDRGAVWDVNEAFVFELGYSKEEVLGVLMQELTIWENVNLAMTLVEELENIKTIRSRELGLKDKNGDISHYLCSMTVIRIGGANCLLLSGTKIEAK